MRNNNVISFLKICSGSDESFGSGKYGKSSKNI